MHLSIFTDEVSPNPQRAMALAVDWDIRAVEVRNLPSGRFPRAADGELAEFGQWVETAGLCVSGVSPGLFKCALDDPQVQEGIDVLLPRSCEWAQRWGTDLVSVFGFLREGGTVPGKVVEYLAQMAFIAAEHGCRLVLENEAVCWGNTGREAADIVRWVAQPNFSLLWDPGNSARAGSLDACPGEYAELRDLVEHVHVKNFHSDINAWSLMADGIVDWAGQLAALEADQYAGYLVVETHVKKRPSGLQMRDGLDGLESNSLDNLDYIRAHLQRLAD